MSTAPQTSVPRTRIPERFGWFVLHLSLRNASYLNCFSRKMARKCISDGWARSKKRSDSLRRLNTTPRSSSTTARCSPQSTTTALERPCHTLLPSKVAHCYFMGALRLAVLQPVLYFVVGCCVLTNFYQLTKFLPKIPPVKFFSVAHILHSGSGNFVSASINFRYISC